MSNQLPPLDENDAKICQVLTEIIVDEIRRLGPITFARYMELVLYHPQYGYYRNGAIKFGSQGDFVTAPEISSLFSQCLANQCAEIFKNLSEPSILEYGAGSGLMAVELLRALEELNALPKSYCIIELSADLRSRQRQLLEESIPHLMDRVQWLEAVPQWGFVGVVIANEVLDAMPVNKFIVDSVPMEQCVTFQDNGLQWQKCDMSSERFKRAFSALDQDFAIGYESEINLFLPGWIKSIAGSMSQGVVLLIDYGFSRSEYYHPERSMGTVMCHFRHRAHADPLVYSGVQDVTAHVDFTAVAESACDVGLDVLGYTNQAGFLVDCGIEKLNKSDDVVTQYKLAQQVKMLTLPSEMGELFKVMALGKEYPFDLLGFLNHDQLFRL